MHILYFHQHFSTPKGATGTRSYEMAQKLIKRGHSVTMVCGSYNVGATGLSSSFVNGRREGDVDGIRVIEFDLSYANTDSFLTRTSQFLKFAWQSIKLALTEKYDVLFATSTPLTAALPGIFAKVLRRKPFVFEVRDLWPELPKAMGVITNPAILTGMSVLEKASYMLANRCIGLSPGIVDGIKKRGRKSLSVDMVPNGCDLDLFSQPVKYALPFAKQDGDVIACFTGAHGLANGLGAILDAAKLLKARGADHIKLVFVGEGKVKAEMQSRAASEGLDNCIFLPAMPKTRLIGFLQQADIGLMTLANVPAFYYGTSPNKFFDYISCGLPVLNNYPGWLADMINEHKCGVAIPPENADAFADALEKMAHDPAALADMGKRGRKLAEDAFNRDALSDAFTSSLEGAV